MKFLLSWLREYVELSVPPEVLAQRLTGVGLEVTDFSRVGKDWLFEAEVTPNRPDLLSHLGIAREAAAALGRKFHFPRWLEKACSSPAQRLGTDFPIEVLEPDGCRRYVGIVLEGVKVQPSPPALAERLQLVGIRPVNNVVDVTNYVLMELGQPLHAFDLDRLEEGRVVVRRAKPGETLVTLDGAERTLTPELLMIADGQRPIALAGVMGGRQTEISSATHRVLIESAWFDPAWIRRARRIVKVASESSYRFERGVDPTRVPSAALRAARLILAEAGGRFASGVTEAGAFRFKRRVISLKVGRAQEVLGMQIYPSQQRRFLERIGCRVRGHQGGLRVEVPSWRSDLKRAEDLYEELARLWGYGRCLPTLPPSPRCAVAVSDRPKARGWGGGRGSTWRADPAGQPVEDLGFWRRMRIRTFLTAAGLQEILTYSLLSQEQLTRCRWGVSDADPTQPGGPALLAIQNPLSNEQALLRPLLLPGALEAASRNFRHKRCSAVRFFEIGHLFDPGRAQTAAATRPAAGALHPAEYCALSLLVAGTPAPSWGEPARALGVFHLKGVIQFLCRRMGLQGVVEQVSQLGPAYLAGKTVTFRWAQQLLGVAGEVDPEIVSGYGFPKGIAVAYAELDLDRLLSGCRDDLRVTPLPKLPPVLRDLAILLPEEVSYEEVYQAIRETGGPLLQDAILFDLYRGRQIPEGKKSMALHLIFSDQDRTLTDEEVSDADQRIRERLKADFKASPR